MDLITTALPAVWRRGTHVPIRRRASDGIHHISILPGGPIDLILIIPTDATIEPILAQIIRLEQLVIAPPSEASSNRRGRGHARRYRLASEVDAHFRFLSIRYCVGRCKSPNLQVLYVKGHTTVHIVDIDSMTC